MKVEPEDTDAARGILTAQSQPASIPFSDTELRTAALPEVWFDQYQFQRSHPWSGSDRPFMQPDFLANRQRVLVVQQLWRALGRYGGLALVLTDELGDGQRQRQRAGGQAAHGEHQREPAGVGVRSLASTASEDGQREQRGDRSGGRRGRGRCTESWRVSRCTGGLLFVDDGHEGSRRRRR